MKTRKQTHNALIRDRAQTALGRLYHNATVTYPRDLRGRSDEYFESWFGDQAHFEIDYLQDGGAYGNNYRATLAHSANAGNLKSEKARAYYIARGMRAMRNERNDCGALTGWRALELAAGNNTLRRRLTEAFGARPLTRNNALWEYISDYGTLYTYGRGSRTLAPDGLWREDGRGHGCKAGPAEMSIPACVNLVRIVESFNAYVQSWCEGVPALWAEHCDNEDTEALAAKHKASAQKARETRERNAWACRGMVTV